MANQPTLEERANVHAALGDPSRLAIVDQLTTSDRAPHELQQRLGIPSNLLAHHLDVLEAASLIERSRSGGDGRRRYVHLNAAMLERLHDRHPAPPRTALFICTANSARSQLAAALWQSLTGAPAGSAGTHPEARIHRGAIAAGRRVGLDLRDAVPTPLGAIDLDPAVTITVCDRAHEELEPGPDWLHWSIPDPVPIGTAAAFDTTIIELRSRITTLAGVA